MTIIFGHNHYCRKSITPEELGIFDAPANVVRFELTQRFVHVFFIPVFPIGVSWCVRTDNAKLYKVDGELKDLLRQIRYSWSSGLLAFIGPLLGLAVFGLYVLQEMREEKAAEQREELRAQEESIREMGLIIAPSLHDYYLFEGKTALYARVLAFNDTAVLLSLARKKYEGYEIKEVVAMLRDSAQNVPAEWVSKVSLGKMLHPMSTFDTTLFNVGAFRINKIERLGDPLLEYHFTMSTSGSFSFSVKNVGAYMIIMGIESITGNVRSGVGSFHGCKYGDIMSFTADDPSFSFFITGESWDKYALKYLVKEGEVQLLEKEKKYANYQY